MGGHSGLCRLQECCVMPKQSHAVQTPTDFKAKGSAYSDPSRVEHVDFPTQGLCTSCNQPMSLSLAPPHLIEVLSVLESLQYCSGYLLKSTNSSTSRAFYLCSGNTRVPCSLQAKLERQTLPHLLQQAPPFFPIQALPFHPAYFVGICPISL